VTDISTYPEVINLFLDQYRHALVLTEPINSETIRRLDGGMVRVEVNTDSSNDFDIPPSGGTSATENSVRINQHLFGTLIADLVDALSLLASTSESKDWQSLLRPVVECIQVQGIRVAKESGLDQQEFGRVDQGEAAFMLQEGKHRCNWLAPAKRRVADTGGVIPRPVESLPRVPVLVVPLPWTPGRLCPKLNAYGTADSRQDNCVASAATISHSTRSRGPGTRVGSSPPAAPQRDFARGIAAP